MTKKMNKSEDLVKKYKLDEVVKKFQKINEYTFYSPTMVEDDQNQNDAQNGGDMQPMDNPQGDNQNPMDGGMAQGEQGGQIPQQGDMGQEPPMDDVGDVSTDGQEDVVPNPMGDGEMPPIGNEDEDIEDVEMDTEQPGDEVVDVDDLTQSQETTEFKVDDLDNKLDKVLKVISKFTDAIEANDQKIEDLKHEFAKRNPTAEETLNLRSMSSYPYSEKPDEYWKRQQETHPNYNVISNNDVPTSEEQKEFEIRKGDIDNFNERDIMKSLGEGHIKLSDFLDF